MRNDKGAFSTLYIDRLTADPENPASTFLVDTDIQGDKTDQIIISNGSGAHKIDVRSSGAEPVREAMNTAIVRDDSAGATFSLANAGEKVDAGLYMYSLAKRDAANSSSAEWYLKRAGGYSPTAEAVLGFSGAASSYALWSAQLADLRQRLGEIRYGNSKDGFWSRGFAQENTLRGLGDIDFSQTSYGGSLGYDHLFVQDDNNKWLFGFKAQASRADQKINGDYGAKGDNTAYGFSGYATWNHADGWYGDLVATWDWYNQNLRTRMLDGKRVTGSYKHYGGGLSLELGRTIHLSNDAFIEPQVQLSSLWLKGTEYTTSNGMKVENEDTCALTGRVGVVLGKKWSYDNGVYVQPYIKAGINHEFVAQQKAKINGEEFKGDLRGSRAYYGAGVDWQVHEHVRIYGEFEREEGFSVSKPWSVSAGIRYSF